MKKRAYRVFFIVLAAVIVLPLIAAISICFAIPPQYSETYLGELAAKYERLKDTDGAKIILIGGSNLAFGVDSATIEEYMDMPVVNFGLYATLGTKLMLDLSKANINKGDIIVVCPEMDPQTLSLYFNAEAAWQAADSDYSMLLHVGKDNAGEMFGGFWDYATAKIGYFTGEGLSPTGVYTKAAFNEYGDISYERPYNTMALGYDPNTPISLKPDIVDDEFIEYLNKYTEYAKRRGATVYFSFPPMNEAAVEGTDDKSLSEFYGYLSGKLDCEVISDPRDYIIDAGYFYDSNYHLNDAGVPIRTMRLVEDLYRAENIYEAVEVVYPDIPEPPASNEGGGSDIGKEFTETPSDMFTYEEFATGLTVTGVKGEAVGYDTIVIPRKHEGKAVLAISAGAFKDCTNMKTLVIFDNIIQLYDGMLSGCKTVTDIYLYNKDCTKISIGTQLLSGAPKDVVIRVPYESFGNYAADYFWSVYAGKLGVISMPDEN